MFLDFVSTISPEPILAVGYEPLKDVCCSRWKICLWWNYKGFSPVQDFLAGDRWLIWKERWITDKHFKKNNTHAPPVNTLVVTLLPKNLRGNIVWCSNRWESKMSGSLVPKLFIKDRLQLSKVWWKLVVLGFTIWQSWRRSDFSMLTQAEIC